MAKLIASSLVRHFEPSFVDPCFQNLLNCPVVVVHQVVDLLKIFCHLLLHLL
jgi:hypothetical protein